LKDNVFIYNTIFCLYLYIIIQSNKTALHCALINGYDDIIDLIFENEKLEESIKEETLKLLQNEGGGDKIIKLMKMMKGEIFGEKVEKSYENYSKLNIISNYFINTMKNQEEKNNNFYTQMINSISKTMINLIEEYKPISNEILMIIYNLNDKNSELLFNKLIHIILEILNPNKFDEIKLSWFNEYLLNSSIWFFKNNENKNINDNNKLFYSIIEENLIKYENEILSKKMKEDIIESKIMDEKEEWSLIINNNHNYEINKKYLNKNVFNSPNEEIRQDNINLFKMVLLNSNDNLNNNNKLKEIENKMIKIEENMKNIESIKNKEILKFYNNKIFISKLHLNSKIINDEVMLNIESMMKPLIEKGIIYKFRKGPIKTLERCIEKTENDYMKENIKFPQSSKLLDTIRCSISFQTLNNLFITLDYFTNFMNENKLKSNSSCIFKGIVRIKNGFIDDENYKFNINNPKYCDLKLNVIVEIKNILMIIEMQFILLSFLKSKKLSHNLYNITRIKSFIDFTFSFMNNQPTLNSLMIGFARSSFDIFIVFILFCECLLLL
jgi:hypothetical protein